MPASGSIPKASVVIPARDRPGDVSRALRSLYAQVGRRDDTEVVVVDDGSTPPLAGVLGPLIERPGFRLVRLEGSRGRGAARNAGIEASRGRVILFMDSDMTAHPGLLDAHLAAHAPDEPVAWIGRIVWTGRGLLHRYLETRGVKKLREGEAVPWRYFDTGNVSVRRADLLAAGRFSEDLPAWGGEDTLMGYDLHRAGVRLDYCPGAVTCHHSTIDVDRLCESRYTFGRESLPIMIESRSGVAPEMRVHYLRRGSPGVEGGRSDDDPAPGAMRSLLVRGLLYVPGRRFVRGLLPFAGPRLSELGFDYLVYSSILRGYRDRLRDAANDSMEAEGDRLPERERDAT